MRILTNNIYGIPNGESRDIFNADVFQDYDAIIINPVDIRSLYTDTIRTSDIFIDKDKNILNEEYGRGIFSNYERRKEQAEGLLNRGGVVVCFLQPLERYGYLTRIDGEDKWVWMTNYDWLLDIENELNRVNYGTGKSIDYIDSNHPFFEYLNTKPWWSAYIDKDCCINWRVLASAYGTNVVSLAKRVGLGHIVILPSGYNDKNGELLECCVKRLLKSQEATPQPSWARGILVSGQEELINKVSKINKEIGNLEQDRNVIEDKNRKLENWKLLLYGKGKHELEPVVRESLKVIGFDVREQPDKDSDGLIVFDGKYALLEIVGSKNTIRIGKFGELQTNIGNFIAAQDKTAKGILIGNPFCEEPLDNRPPKDSQKKLFADELIESSEKLGVAVLLTTDLYEVIGRHLGGQLSEEERQNIIDSIINGRGLVRISFSKA